MNRLRPNALPFQRRDILSPNHLGDFDVRYRHQAILDLVALKDIFEILLRRRIQRTVEPSGSFCFHDLPRRETFLVLGDSADEREVLVFSWIEVVQSVLVLAELLFRLALRLAVDDKFRLVAIISDAVLLS